MVSSWCRRRRGVVVVASLPLSLSCRCRRRPLRGCRRCHRRCRRRHPYWWQGNGCLPRLETLGETPLALPFDLNDLGDFGDLSDIPPWVKDSLRASVGGATPESTPNRLQVDPRWTPDRHVEHESTP